MIGRDGKRPLVVSSPVCSHRDMKWRYPCMKLRTKLALTAAALVVVIGCVTNEAGRRTLMPLVSQNEEMQLGLNSFEQLKKETPISADPAANDMVRRVGER